MRKIYAKNTSPERLVGFNEIWYSAQNDLGKEQGIRVPERTIEQAISHPKWYGLQIGDRNFGNLKWTPIQGSYHTDGYLLGSSLIITNELKLYSNTEIFLKAKTEQEENKLKAINQERLMHFPKYVLSIMSQSKHSLAETAQTIGLSVPLEHLVEKSLM